VKFMPQFSPHSEPLNHMKTGRVGYNRSALLLSALGMSALLSSVAHAGDVYLTGHDVTLHSGQAGYDAVILDYLRGATPKASYSIGVVGTYNNGGANFTGSGVNIPSVVSGSTFSTAGSTLTGYASARFYDAVALAALPSATRDTILAGFSVLVVLSHENCGGCSMTTAGANALASMSANIATAFNNGMDIFGESSAGTAGFYNFLPPSAAASGPSIGSSSGFTATAAGTALGIVNGMINGYQTHNEFTSVAAAFTVFEVRGAQIISIGLKDGVITTGGITTGGTAVPDSGSAAFLLALALPALGYLRRKIRS